MSGEYTYTIPEYIADAFITVYAYGANDEAYEAFASRWAGLDVTTFREAALHGEGDDRLVALFALSNLVIPETSTILSSFLKNPRRLERLVAAVALAKRQDEHAFALLKQFLSEGIPFEERLQAENESVGEQADEIFWLLHCSDEAVKLLERKYRTAVIPLLKKEFQRHWAVERAYGQAIHHQDYYDTLAYALGYAGDFTLVQEPDLPLAHRNVALVYMALGALDYTIPSFLDFHSDLNTPALQQKISAVLAQHTNLSAQDLADCVEQFTDYKKARANYNARESAPGDGTARITSAQNEQAQLVMEEEEEEEDIDVAPQFDPVVLCVYTGHMKRVHSLSWSPNSRLLASGSGDGTVQIWNPVTGQNLLTFRRHIESVNAVSWSPQGNYLASAGNDSLVYVWEATTGKPLTVYQGHSAWINRGLAWSPDGTRLVSASWDHTVQIWEAETGKTLQTYRGHSGVVCSVAWSPDGKYIASGGGFPECLVHVWDAETGELVQVYRGHAQDVHGERHIPAGLHPYAEEQMRGPSSVHSLAWSSTNAWIASAGLRLISRVWEATTGRNVLKRDNVGEPMVWSPDSRFVIAPASYDLAHVAQWSVADNRARLIYTPHLDAGIQALAWSPDGQFIATSSSFSEVKVWQAALLTAVSTPGEEVEGSEFPGQV